MAPAEKGKALALENLDGEWPDANTWPKLWNLIWYIFLIPTYDPTLAMSQRSNMVTGYTLSAPNAAKKTQPTTTTCFRLRNLWIRGSRVVEWDWTAGWRFMHSYILAVLSAEQQHRWLCLNWNFVQTKFYAKLCQYDVSTLWTGIAVYVLTLHMPFWRNDWWMEASLKSNLSGSEMLYICMPSMYSL